MANNEEMDNFTTSTSIVDDRLAKLKRNLEGYREIILPLNKILEWEKRQYPAVLVGLITLVFSVIWYCEPSVLTTFSLLGFVLCVIDFAVPTLSGYLFSSSEWTVIQERQFESICTRLLNAKTHCYNLTVILSNLKADRPKVYLVMMMGAFALLAWIGSLLDNLLMTYLLVVFVVMVPGLRKRGILQKVTNKLKALFFQLVKGTGNKTTKTKTN